MSTGPLPTATPAHRFHVADREAFLRDHCCLRISFPLLYGLGSGQALLVSVPTVLKTREGGALFVLLPVTPLSACGGSPKCFSSE